MGKHIDRTGEKFGMLTVIEDKPGQYGHPRVTCRCDCGNIVTRQKGSVVNGSATHCGCSRKRSEKYIDTTGTTYGILTVIEDNPGQGVNPRVTCRCECGKILTQGKSQLKQRVARNKKVLSCGCFRLAKRTGSRPYSKMYRRWVYLEKRGMLHKDWCDFRRMIADIGIDKAGRSIIAARRGEPIGPDNYEICEGHARMTTVDGQRESITHWAAYIGITTERGRQLKNQGRLADRVKIKQLEDEVERLREQAN